MVDKQPGLPGFVCTSDPNGHMASIPSFTICMAKGIPMIDIKKGTLAIKYSSAVKKPPNINQIILPNNFMFLVLDLQH